MPVKAAETKAMGEPADEIKRMSREEYLAWLELQDEPYELVDGIPVPLWPDEENPLKAMAGPNVRHQRITQAAGDSVRARLHPPCWAIQAGNVELTTGAIRIPDVVASCTEPGRNDEFVTDPILIVEVLSKTTRGKDRGDKLDEYKLLPSVREIWLVDSDRRWAQVWWRESETQWLGRDYIGAGTFESAVLGAVIDLDALYGEVMV